MVKEGLLFNDKLRYCIWMKPALSLLQQNAKNKYHKNIIKVK